MNGLSVSLHDRKRLLLTVSMATVFVLLVGGPNALANTVRCVPNLNVNPGCVAPAYATISAAVTAASPYDVIVVGPGHYNESVAIYVSITILGAQAGRDAREGRDNPAKESIVDATNKEGTTGAAGGGAAFYVGAPLVVIDGFTIEGGGVTNGSPGPYASGIFAAAPNTRILNNIIQNNAVGVYIFENSPHLVEYNLFKTNNAGAAGSSVKDFAGTAGYGVAVYSSSVNIIIENEFEGNLAAAVVIDQSGDAEITKNTSKNDGSFAVFYKSCCSFFNYNQGRDFGAQGFILFPGVGPSGLPRHADAAVDVGYENAGIQINDNDLEEGKTPNYNGIAFSTIFGNGVACGNCHVTKNKIKRFASNGIIAEESSGGEGTLVYSEISGNDVEDNGNDGILIQQLGSNFYNTLVDNEAEGNSVNDCEDDTYIPPVGPGSGTAETYNTWFNNIGTLRSPVAICAPGAGNYYEY